MDFTLKKYQELLEVLQALSVKFVTYEEFCASNADEARLKVVLRHDVDLLPQNSLETARIENKMGIAATYYFRALPCSYDITIVKEIVKLGHEVGYHYEDLVLTNGDIDLAYHHFTERLAEFRTLYPVRTICMHGSPVSEIDPKALWSKYDYQELGIIGEPYFDTAWNKVFYLTDTGRRWDGFKVSLRDKVELYQPLWSAAELTARSTDDVIELFRSNKLSRFESVMITTHPQRWSDSKLNWIKEFLLQNTKNIAKRFLINSRMRFSIVLSLVLGSILSGSL